LPRRTPTEATAPLSSFGLDIRQPNYVAVLFILPKDMSAEFVAARANRLESDDDQLSPNFRITLRARHPIGKFGDLFQEGRVAAQEDGT
jgi:hypothetical protein